MKTLKNVLVVALLGVLACSVFVACKNNADSNDDGPSVVMTLTGKGGNAEGIVVTCYSDNTFKTDSGISGTYTAPDASGAATITASELGGTKNITVDKDASTWSFSA